MENTKKFRNPFPAIGKIFKYEMISGARIILPMYAILLILSLIIGIFIMDNNLDFDSEGPFAGVKVVLFVLTCILFVVMIVIVLSIIERRFKKSMLGDEAYLNCTLPVTIGEHLWGRYLADLVWALAYAVAMILSVALMLIRGWSQLGEHMDDIREFFIKFRESTGVGFAQMFTMSVVNALVFFMLICVFCYMTNTIIEMIGKHKTLVTILIFAGVFFIFSNCSNLVFSIVYNRILVAYNNLQPGLDSSAFCHYKSCFELQI